MRQWDSGLERRLRVLPPPAELCAANRHPPNRRGRITAPKCRQPDRAESAESQVRRKQSRHDLGTNRRSAEASKVQKRNSNYAPRDFEPGGRQMEPRNER